jgi:alcohol dehydrogenase class IV
MAFEFATATRIVFGEGTLAQAAPAAARMGTRAMLVRGASAERAAPLHLALENAALAVVPMEISGEPTVGQIRAASEFARDERCDLVVAIGGGSVIDAGKAIAAMLTNPGEPLDYLEVIGHGRPLQRTSAPFIAIPTTAGTGSEVTRNAVLASPAEHVKASLRSPGMLPTLAIVDPELTLGLPPAITASTGLDALAQLIEPYVSTRANPMTDLFCMEGIRNAAIALPRAWENGGDRAARSAMSWASLLGGLSLANAGLGAVHGFAAPIGGMFPAPHGAVCAALLPHVIEANVEALHARAPHSDVLRRYDTVARLLTGQRQATAADAVWWLQELTRKLEIPPLRAYGIAETDFAALASKAAQASSMKANPVELTEDELREILEKSL